MESGSAKEESIRAHQAVKKFAMHVNNEIAKFEVCKRWDRVRSQIDRSSKGRFGLNDFFTVRNYFFLHLSTFLLLQKEAFLLVLLGC